jgi:hypothetical protein
MSLLNMAEGSVDSSSTSSPPLLVRDPRIAHIPRCRPNNSFCLERRREYRSSASRDSFRPLPVAGISIGPESLEVSLGERESSRIPTIQQKSAQVHR